MGIPKGSPFGRFRGRVGGEKGEGKLMTRKNECPFPLFVYQRFKADSDQIIGNKYFNEKL
jgi:hypothetical protein